MSLAYIAQPPQKSYRNGLVRKLFEVLPDGMTLLQNILRKIKDVPKLLLRLQTMPGNFSGTDFQGLRESLANLLLLRDTLTALSQVHQTFPRKLSAITTKYAFPKPQSPETEMPTLRTQLRGEQRAKG